MPAVSSSSPSKRHLWTPGTGYAARRDDPHRRPTLELREGTEKRLRRGHPWVFPREVRNPDALAQLSPCLVNVADMDGEVLGVALYSKQATIAARVLSEHAFVQVDAAFFADRFRRCLERRELFFAEPFYRLAHAEADGLPGLVVDRFGDHLVVQPSAAGLDALLWPIVDALEEVLAPAVVVVRQDSIGRRQEQAALQREVVRGQYVGPTELRENGVTFCVDLLHGQKTGWYYDHRDHRSQLAALAPKLPRVLDLYSYVGGFGVTMAHYGSSEVVCVDSSKAALELCQRSAALNNVEGRVQTVCSDVLKFLAAFDRTKKPNGGGGDEDEEADTAQHSQGAGMPDEFDLVIVDPPNLHSDRTNVPKAVSFYSRLVAAAAQACAPGGLLFLGSCTHHVGEAELMGALDRGLRWQERSGRVVATGGQGADHPGHFALPQSRYLRSLLVQLD